MTFALELVSADEERARARAKVNERRRYLYRIGVNGRLGVNGLWLCSCGRTRCMLRGGFAGEMSFWRERNSDARRPALARVARLTAEVQPC